MRSSLPPAPPPPGPPALRPLLLVTAVALLATGCVSVEPPPGGRPGPARTPAAEPAGRPSALSVAPEPGATREGGSRPHHARRPGPHHPRGHAPSGAPGEAPPAAGQPEPAAPPGGVAAPRRGGGGAPAAQAPVHRPAPRGRPSYSGAMVCGWAAEGGLDPGVVSACRRELAR